jgi:hypothetical protein
MDELIDKINFLKNTMTSVSTGGQRIQDVNDEYKKLYREVTIEIKRLGLKNPNPYSDLWEWYGKWSSGEMPQYRDRRAYIIELFKPILSQLENHNNSEELEVELTGWERIERSVGEVRLRLGEAQNEEQFQAVGLICRETIISLAQEVFDAEKHPTTDGVQPSSTDAKRMLDAYISNELPGKENEGLRRYAKSTNALANELTHKRTATLKLAKLCSSASINLVNLFRILEED